MTTRPFRIEIDVPSQRLRVVDDKGRTVMDLPVSTARNGVGEVMGSEQTPRGKHIVCARIGAGQPPNAVFVARRPTGEIYTPGLRQLHPERDWILTRILWLKGLERGRNRMGQVDTMRRYIYIHGMPDEDPVGMPGSRGCIRVRNADLIRLFDLVEAGTPVEIFG
jgi:lipoprotein-anchoring transpeptidase ErfK/SrfK